MYGSPWIVLPSAIVSFDARTLVHLRLKQLSKRDLFACAVRNLNADGRLSRNAVDENRLGLHGEAQIIGEARDLSVFHSGVRLELEGRDDRARMNLCNRTFDCELTAFLFEQARAFHQLALVDLPLGLRCIEKRQWRKRKRAVPSRLARLRFGQRQRGILRALWRACPSPEDVALRR